MSWSEGQYGLFQLRAECHCLARFDLHIGKPHELVAEQRDLDRVCARIDFFDAHVAVDVARAAVVRAFHRYVGAGESFTGFRVNHFPDDTAGGLGNGTRR